MADMIVPQSASPLHKKVPLNPSSKWSHDLSSPLPLPTSGLPAGVSQPTSIFNDFDDRDQAFRRSFSIPIDDPMEEIVRLRRELEEKDKHIEELEESKMKLLKEGMHHTKIRQQESKSPSSSKMSEATNVDSGQLQKKLTAVTSQRDSKEMMCLKLTKNMKDLCLQNERLKDELADKSSILGEYKKLIEKLEEEIEDLKDGGGKENRDREELLEKLLDEISHLNEDLDASRQEVEDLKVQLNLQQQDSDTEIDYLRKLLQTEDLKRRTDDEVVVDVLNQMENARLSKFLYSLIKMDGKDVLDIQDLVTLLESGTISMRRRPNTGGITEEDLSANNENSDGNKGSDKPQKGHGDKKDLNLNLEKKCIVRVMDFLSDEQLVEVGSYLREFFHYSAEFEGGSL